MTLAEALFGCVAVICVTVIVLIILIGVFFK